MIPAVDGDRVARGVPLIVGLARSQTNTGDDNDSTGAAAKRTAGASLT
jgi:hypothetical protein